MNSIVGMQSRKINPTTIYKTEKCFVDPVSLLVNAVPDALIVWDNN